MDVEGESPGGNRRVERKYLVQFVKDSQDGCIRCSWYPPLPRAGTLGLTGV